LYFTSGATKLTLIELCLNVIISNLALVAAF